MAADCQVRRHLSSLGTSGTSTMNVRLDWQWNDLNYGTCILVSGWCHANQGPHGKPMEASSRSLPAVPLDDLPPSVRLTPLTPWQQEDLHPFFLAKSCR